MGVQVKSLRITALVLVLATALFVAGCSGGKSIEGEWIITKSSNTETVGSRLEFTEDGWMILDDGTRWRYEQPNAKTLEVKLMLTQSYGLEWLDDGSLIMDGTTYAPFESKQAHDALASKARREEQRRAEQEAEPVAAEEEVERVANEAGKTADAERECKERLGMELKMGVGWAWRQDVYGNSTNHYFNVVLNQVTGSPEYAFGGFDDEEVEAKFEARMKESAAAITTYEQLVAFLNDTDGPDGNPLLPVGDYACPAGGTIVLEWPNAYGPELYCSVHSPRD